MRTNELGLYKKLAMFALVVEQGTFAGAANKLRTSRSRVSETISDLEHELNVRLLNRSTRNLALTREGKAVYEQAGKLSQILDNVTMITNQKAVQGRVSLTCTNDVAIKQLRPALVDFEKRWPDIQIDLIVNDERMDIISEEIDIAIRIGLPKDESLVGRSLFRENLQIFASPNYLDGRKPINSITDLNNERWVLINQLSNHKKMQTFFYNEEQQSITFKKHHMCNSPLMAQQMVVSGMGLGIFLPVTVKEEVRLGRLVPVLPEWKAQMLTFALIYPSRKQLPMRTRYLIEHLLTANLFND